ncbi:MAG: hypothetical protein ABJP45_08875 [Cyclobacteriaceae bacterium]
MKGILKVFIAVVTFVGAMSCINAQANYESTEIKRITTKMTEAHGGLEKWRDSPSLYFETNLVAHNGMFPEYNEQVTIHPISRKTYVDFPDEAGNSRRQLAHDGEKAWAVGAGSGLEMAPARFTCWRNFYLLNLPFVMHDAGVTVSDLREVRIPGKKMDGYSVKLTFGGDVGDSSNDFYLLYINKNTFRLEGAEYNMTYASMLPKGLESLPASVLTFETFEKVEGLLLPTSYKVHWQQNMEHIITGKVSNWDTRRSFDYARMEIPSEAQLDTSIPK